MDDARRDKLKSLAIERDEPAGRSGAGLVAIGIVALVALVAGAAGGWMLRGAPEPAQSTAATSQTSAREAPDAAAEPAPAAAPRPRGLVASGYVVARRQATVSAEITGRIAEVLAEEGLQVEQGQVLARLDDARARLDLDLLIAQRDAAQARIASLQARAREAGVVLGRTEALAQRDFASDAQRTAADANRASLLAELEAARADLAAVEARVASQEDLIERHVVRAPFAGVVIAKNAQVGEILSPVSAGGGFTRTGVATLVDMDSLEIEVDVNEGQIQRVRAGQPVEAVLDAYPDQPIPARVEAIIPTADRARATIQVRVALLDRDARILPDMAARVTFLEDREG